MILKIVEVNMPKIKCNVCGIEIGEENTLIKKDFLMVKKEWGYFSKKDKELHQFNLCESCYDAWIKTFQIPVEKTEVTELL
ncbi:MAG: hypothetical protein PWP24_1662 [Clostridiales bacterium]|nr:hypothetical protein [Clostridiales bacterium]